MNVYGVWVISVKPLANGCEYEALERVLPQMMAAVSINYIFNIAEHHHLFFKMSQKATEFDKHRGKIDYTGSASSHFAHLEAQQW